MISPFPYLPVARRSAVVLVAELARIARDARLAMGDARQCHRVAPCGVRPELRKLPGPRAHGAENSPGEAVQAELAPERRLTGRQPSVRVRTIHVGVAELFDPRSQGGVPPVLAFRLPLG